MKWAECYGFSSNDGNTANLAKFVFAINFLFVKVCDQEEGVILPEGGGIWELYHDCCLGYKAKSGYY